MHLFLCVAVAVFLVGSDARANSARSLSAGRSAKRHLKSHESPDNAEERVSSPVKFDLADSALGKYLLEEANAEANAWTLPHDLDASALKENKHNNLKELLDSWTPLPPVEPPLRVLDFSSARLREWVKTNGNDAPDVLFKMLGIPDEVKKEIPNGLLVSFNLKRWYRSTGGVGDVDAKGIYAIIVQFKRKAMYSFGDRIIEFAKDTEPELGWLVRGEKPEEVFKNLKLDHDFKRDEMSKWIEYVDAFNNVYPAKAIPFLTVFRKQFPGAESTAKALLDNEFPQELPGTAALEKADGKKLKEFCYSRALPPAIVRNLVGLSPNEPKTAYDFRRFAFLQSYVNDWNSRFPSLRTPVHLMKTMKETYSFVELRILRDNGKTGGKLTTSLSGYINTASLLAGENITRGRPRKRKQMTDVAGTSAPRGRPKKKQMRDAAGTRAPSTRSK